MDKGHRSSHHTLTKGSEQSEGQSWDSAESDTESLAQERAYQQQLQLKINNYRPRGSVFLNKNIHCGKDDGLNDEEAEDPHVFDSLEISQHVMKNPAELQGKYLDPQGQERNTKSQVFLDDTYSHLCYDANPKMILNEPGRLDEGPLISIDESFLVFQDKHHGQRKQAVRKDAYTLITSTSPPELMTPQSHSYDQPYLLHPQYGHNSVTATPPPPQSSTLPLDNNHNRTLSSTDFNKTVNNSSSAESSVGNAKPKHMQGNTVQQMLSPKIERRTEDDIVERNKLTLGRNTSKYGSYSKAHARKMPQSKSKASKETSSADIQNKTWLQKTQQVKGCHMSKENKAQRKESLILPAPEVRPGQRDSLSSSVTKAAAKAQSKPPSSSQPLAPTIHLSISLNSTPRMPPFPSQKGQESIINLGTYHNSSHTNPQVHVALSAGQTTQRAPSMIYQEGLHAHWDHFGHSADQWQGLAALKENEDLKDCLPEDRTAQFVQQLPGTPTSTLSQSSSSYRVLPPITRPGPETDSELSPTAAGQRRVSDGYLVQMEKQKLLKTMPAYKAYTLKDYKQLKPDVFLRGLGPDYTAVEKTKMRQQKLYSNAVREQNKKTTRIPSLPAKDSEDKSKKVPRLKALEYAKTIAKPCVPVQFKEKEKQLMNVTEGLPEPTPGVEDLDLTQLTTLQLLRERHEKEKQAVALLRKIHAV